MNSRSLIPVLRVLAGCLHLLVVGLLALAAVRAVTEQQPHVRAIVAVAGAVAVLYLAGPWSPPVRRSSTMASVWLAALTAVWLVLLWLTPDGVWVAFPLFFVQLHLLPTRRGIAAVALTTAAAIGGFAWHQHVLNPGAVIGPALGAAVSVATVLGYQALYRESERRRQLIEELVAARSDLDAAERAAGQLAERERLAREIHDTVAQGLSSIQLLLRAAEMALPAGAERAAGHVTRAREAAQSNLAEARRFVRDWSPPELEGGSLPAALERLCSGTARSSSLAVTFHLSGTPVELPEPYEVALLRIAQSALGNTVEHAGASRAELTLSYMDTEVALDAFDDGVGFDAETTSAASGGVDHGFGLAAMRARTRSLHGSLAVESTPGQGTAVAATLPYPSTLPERTA